MEAVITIGGIIVGIVIWGLYHKLFNVTYFGWQALLTEFMVCCIIGYGIMTMAVEYWVIIAIVLAILILFACLKGKK